MITLQPVRNDDHRTETDQELRDRWRRAAGTQGWGAAGNGSAEGSTYRESRFQNWCGLVRSPAW